MRNQKNISKLSTNYIHQNMPLRNGWKLKKERKAELMLTRNEGSVLSARNVKRNVKNNRKICYLQKINRMMTLRLIVKPATKQRRKLSWALLRHNIPCWLLLLFPVQRQTRPLFSATQICTLCIKCMYK